MFHKANYQTIIIPNKLLPKRRSFLCLCCNFRWVSTHTHTPFLSEWYSHCTQVRILWFQCGCISGSILVWGRGGTDVCNHRPFINNPRCSYKKRSIDRHLKNDNANNSNVFITITGPCCRCFEECSRLLIFFWDANEESGDDTGDNGRHKMVFTNRTLAPHLLD